VELSLRYGSGVRKLRLPDEAEVHLLQPQARPVLADPAAALEKALGRPLEAARLEEMTPPRRVTVAVPDESRPTPVRTLLPVILARLFRAFPRLKPDQVTVIVGAGLHPPLDRAGLDRVVPPEAVGGVRVIGHDARRSAMEDRGRTGRGTPVAVNAELARADLKISLGQIDPHQFVGFTGGAKGAAIGCGAAATIEANHGLMFHERARAGVLEGNPVREDINEAGDLIGLDLAVNVVLDPDKRVAALLAGRPEAVLKAGAPVCAQVYGLALEERYDLVIASCGGHPKDICLYQAQKGLNLASQALKPGGGILLLAACPQGVGDETYAEYVGRFQRPEDVLADFRQQGFRMGAHKAYLFARTLSQYEVVVDSDLEAETLARCQIRAGRAQETIDRWLDRFQGRPRVAVVPQANTTYFYQAGPAGPGGLEGPV